MGLLFSLGLVKGSIGVGELAPEAVGAVHVGVVLLAELGLVLGGYVLLLEELEAAVSERTKIAKFTLASVFPVSAYL